MVIGKKYVSEECVYKALDLYDHDGFISNRGIFKGFEDKLLYPSDPSFS